MKSGSLTTAYTITSRPSGSTPAASQPKIIGSRSVARPTPRSDQTSWWFSAAAFTSTLTQPSGTAGGSISDDLERSQRVREIGTGGVSGEHARRVRPVPDADVVAAAFTDQTGRPPAGIWAAPGRVNLIGEHTDYNDGFVMPFALAQRVTVAAAPRSDGTWRVMSLNNDDRTVVRGPRSATGDDGLGRVRRRGGLGAA